MQYDKDSEIHRSQRRQKFYMFRDPYREKDDYENEKFSIPVRILILVGVTSLCWFGIYKVVTLIF